MGAGIECVGHSGARGGKDVKPQDRVSALYALSFVEKLLPERCVFENVSQFQNWGNIFSEDGEDDGGMFELFISMLNQLGYNVDWKVLTAADYGDPQLRDRLIILASRDGKPTFPTPTHSPDGEQPGTEPYRTAADIIDWDDPGESIWSRDLTGRQRVLSHNTMQRVAKGLSEHGGPALEPVAEFIKTLGREQDLNEYDAATRTIPALRENAVPFYNASLVASLVNEPFLVELPSEASEKYSLVLGHRSFPRSSPPDQRFCSPSITRSTLPTDGAGNKPDGMIVRQFGGATPTHITTPLPTIATAGAHALATNQTRLILPRNKVHRGRHSNPAYDVNDRPLHTITAKNHSGWTMCPDASFIGHYSHGGTVDAITDPLRTIATERGGAFSLSVPYLTDYHGTGTTQPIDEPLRTVECKDRFSIMNPSKPVIGFDLKYRMLKPLELARGQGFDDDYQFTGTKTDKTKQIGNAIPINMARAVVRQLLSETVPTINTYTNSDSHSPEKHKQAADRINTEINRVHDLMDSPPADD